MSRTGRYCREHRCLLVLLLVVALLGFCTGATLTPQNVDLSVEVLSFNIRYGTARDGSNHWDRRRESVIRLLRDQNSDVVGLQEALRFQIDVILAAMPEYGDVGVGRDDGRTQGEYCGILYRRSRFAVADSGTFWLSDTPEVPGSITWGNACTRICTWARLVDKASGRGIYVYNLHLDHVSQPSREKSAVLLGKRIQKRAFPDPFVVLGDFNVGEDNPAIEHLKDAKGLALRDSFRVLHPDAEKVGTFNGFKGRRKGDKIDYVLVSLAVQVKEADIVLTSYGGRWPSDHFPVRALLRFPLSTGDSEATSTSSEP